MAGVGRRVDHARENTRKKWIIPVRISPAQVDHPRENTWIMLVGNDNGE